MRLLLRHWLFCAVLALATALRALTMIGYPAIWFEDSFEYVGVAQRIQPYPVRPSGYSFLLWAMEPLHSFLAVAALQHLMGLATGVMVYALIRRRASGLPKWVAVLAAAPVLLDAYQIFFEHAVLSDVLFSFLAVSAVTVALWEPEFSARRAAAVGLLLAAATLTRSIGLVLLPLLVGYLLLRRLGWRTLLAATFATTLPLGGYAAWYASWHDYPALNGGSGVWIWARTMPFADCARIRPPTEETVLCPPQPVGLRPSSPYFIWSDWSPLRKVPGHPVTTRADLFQPEINELAGSLARRAIVGQPGDYLETVLRDLGQTLNWRRGPNPNSSVIGYNRYAFPNTRAPLPDGVRIPGAGIQQDLRTYEQGPVTVDFTEPAATVMRTYQASLFVPGTVFGVFAVLATLVHAATYVVRSRRGAAREAALPLLFGIALIAGPVVITTYDSRYWLPAVPMFCLALAITLDRTTLR
ncbi:hypothetical protein AB0395_29410 [Streptosporangium sp. NPDC051023]|uniref:hypothetical protein n=1 Tax=Streptosporangium sp. NPDC051023 TaxID=3155410 RepID=UPI00344ECF81